MLDLSPLLSIDYISMDSHQSIPKLKNLLHSYKSRLQNYAMKKNGMAPTYSYEISGPPHNRQFKSSVTVDKESYDTPNFFSTLKDAENAAAKVAYAALSLDNTQEDESFYKNFLQIFAQKNGLCFPTYETEQSGPSHMPTFTSTVKIADKISHGQNAKTKKLAEMSAAKAAYISFTECQEKHASLVEGTSEVSSINLKSDVLEEVKKDYAIKSNVSIQEQAEEIKGQEKQASLVEGNLEVSLINLQSNDMEDVKKDVAIKSNVSIEEQAEEIKVTNGKRQRNSSAFEDTHAEERGPAKDPRNAASLSTLNILVPSGQRSSAVKKILVLPHTPGMAIPEGAIILPISDDQWVARVLPSGYNSN